MANGAGSIAAEVIHIPTFTCSQLLRMAQVTGHMIFEESYTLLKSQFYDTEPYYAYAVRVGGRRLGGFHLTEAIGAAWTLDLAAEVAAGAFCAKLLAAGAIVGRVEFPEYKLLSNDVDKMIRILCGYNDCLCDGLRFTFYNRGQDRLHRFRCSMTNRTTDVNVAGEGIHENQEAAKLAAKYDFYRQQYDREFGLLPGIVKGNVKLDHYEDRWQRFKYNSNQTVPAEAFADQIFEDLSLMGRRLEDHLLARLQQPPPQMLMTSQAAAQVDDEVAGSSSNSGFASVVAISELGQQSPPQMPIPSQAAGQVDDDVAGSSSYAHDSAVVAGASVTVTELPRGATDLPFTFMAPLCSTSSAETLNSTAASDSSVLTKAAEEELIQFMESIQKSVPFLSPLSLPCDKKQPQRTSEAGGTVSSPTSLPAVSEDDEDDSSGEISPTEGRSVSTSGRQEILRQIMKQRFDRKNTGK